MKGERQGRPKESEEEGDMGEKLGKKALKMGLIDDGTKSTRLLYLFDPPHIELELYKILKIAKRRCALQSVI